jgi:Tol biopolymer transport system component
MDEAANREYPTGSQPELYEVPAGGGRPLQLLTTPAEDARQSKDGRYIIYQDKKGGENTWRKHHTSAIARDIWIYDSKTGQHRKLTTFAGEDRNPIFSADEKSVFYLSEESGSFNVHKMPLEGGRSQQLTSFKQVPVRFLSSSDNGTLCFGFDGQIYTMASGASLKQVNVSITSDTRANAERIMAVNNGASELTVSPSGKEVAFTYRGDVFVAGVDGGGTKRITNTPEVERGLEFSPDGKALIYASERGGKWAIYEARRQRAAEPYFYASTVVTETPVVSNDRSELVAQVLADGSEVSYLEDRNTLRIYNVASKQSRTLLTDKELFGNDHYYQWSPDSKWILFDLDVPGIAPGEVGLVRADGSGKVVNLTESGFNDARGNGFSTGKAMLWFSNRDGLKSVAQSGSAQQDVYAMFFDRDAWEKSRLSKDEFALAKEIDSLATRPPRPDTSKAAGETAPVTQAGGARKKDLVLDLDGIENRKARLTIHSSSLSDALVSKTARCSTTSRGSSAGSISGRRTCGRARRRWCWRSTRTAAAWSGTRPRRASSCSPTAQSRKSTRRRPSATTSPSPARKRSTPTPSAQRCSTTSGVGRATRSTPRAITASIGSAARRLREVSPYISATTTSSPR